MKSTTFLVHTRRSRVVILCTVVCAQALFTATPSVHASFLLPNYNHTFTATNATGQRANDLHVSVLHPITGAKPTAPRFPTETHTTFNMDFSGANVPNGTKVKVNWQSKFATDKATAANWTLGGVNIGAIPEAALKVSALFEEVGDGVVNVSLFNDTGAAFDYTNLQVFNNIPTGPNDDFFATDQYLDHMTKGESVTLLVPPSGSFGIGPTPILKMFTPTLGLHEYTAGSLDIDFGDGNGPGHIFGLGSSMAIPAPGSLVLLLLGGVSGLLGRRRRRSS